jgi:hypothetical protein
MRTHNWFDRGIVSGILHLILGAIFGSVMFAVVCIWFVNPTWFWRLIIFGAITFGVAAVIWRSRFWAFIANNPLFFAYRRIFGSGFWL